MKISSAAIKDGNFEDKYGAKGTDFANKLPALSIPFEISEVPITAESFVVILKDDNAIPIMGQPWTHWSIANLKELKNSRKMPAAKAEILFKAKTAGIIRDTEE